MLVFNNLAFNLVEKGDSLDEADQAVRRALALDPDSDLATLTQIYLRFIERFFAAA